MPGVGKLLKQAQRVQQRIADTQARLAQTAIEVSHGGGAVRITVNGNNEVTALSLDPEFLREDKTLVEQTLFAALKEAGDKARALHTDSMNAATEGFSLPSF
ncbi:MAG: YbaB/EbfC family nucleoid-associated protein [Puniceicoccales bacterium]|jgi:DNA-binding YbaB/EbfC family protein|nr:YbaB/EbfC family nucleoid-associated protein [Puniceicoccales bacterium]